MAIYALDGNSPQIAEKSSWVAENADIIGNVHIGENCSIWFGAVLRADNDIIKIDDGSNIQDGAIIHVDSSFPVKIGKNCTIGHRAIIHGCTIEDNVLVGMGAIIMNGAHIGKNSIVGAASLVTEGKIFPENSLIMGAPAKAVAVIDEMKGKIISEGAQHYQEKITRYQSSLEKKK